MAKSKSARPAIGDVVEIPTGKGLAYAQYTHEHATPPKYGSLLRILPGVYDSRPADLLRLLAEREQFLTFFPLRSELRRKDTRFVVIGNFSIPSFAQPFPTFRNGLPDGMGKVHVWWLWNGTGERRAGPLTPEIRALSDLGVVNDTRLIEMIETGWTPDQVT